MCVVSALLTVGFVLTPPVRTGGAASARTELAGRAAGLRLSAARTSYSAEEEKALRVCRIEFAPYPAGKYNKIVEDGDGRAAAFDACRRDLPALASWSDEEIEATYDQIKVQPLSGQRSLSHDRSLLTAVSAC